MITNLLSSNSLFLYLYGKRPSSASCNYTMLLIVPQNSSLEGNLPTQSLLLCSQVPGSLWMPLFFFFFLDSCRETNLFDIFHNVFHSCKSTIICLRADFKFFWKNHNQINSPFLTSPVNILVTLQDINL